MKARISLSEMLGIEHNLLVAPMFLISNSAMVISALKAGATAAIPALNYRTDEELREAIKEIREATDKPFGFNLIVNKSNPYYMRQLATLCELKVDFIITSLGNPKQIIEACKPLGIKVFCDVVNLEYALKVEALGADALIAVGSEAGGHCGPISNNQLLPELLNACKIPVIAAGGVGTSAQYRAYLEKGAAGVSVGTIFIATEESPVSNDYKQAIVDYGAKDIVLSTKLSGMPLTVINTAYVQKIGTQASWLERVLQRNKRIRKYVKMVVYARGMKKLEKAAFSASYQTVWVAGPSIEYVKEIRSVGQLVKDLVLSPHDKDAVD